MALNMCPKPATPSTTTNHGFPLRDSATSEGPVLSDQLPPVLVTADEATRKVSQSTVSLFALLAGRVARDEIELAFSRQGCGAVLVQLDQRNCDIYETFYRLQSQLGYRAFGTVATAKSAAASFAAFDLPVRQLLCECALAVARARTGLARPTSVSPVELTKFLLSGAHPLKSAVGRPLAADRQEFHPCVDWLIEQEKAGRLRRDENPALRVITVVNEAGRIRRISGRVQADEAQLLALYREWRAAGPDERCGHGNKCNGNVYYGAYRGRTHLDIGSTTTVLFGPGDLRDRAGCAANCATNSFDLGGTLMVAAPSEERFVPLPYRLPCGLPYVVVFFEKVPELPTPRPFSTPLVEVAEDGVGIKAGTHPEDGRPVGINTNALGWAATVHGVRRIENPGFSRGQTVMHVLLTDSDLE